MDKPYIVQLIIIILAGFAVVLGMQINILGLIGIIAYTIALVSTANFFMRQNLR